MTTRAQVLEEIRDKSVAKSWRIVTAESCTGGGVAHALTELEGASQLFDCGFVTYSDEMKKKILQVQPETLDQFGAVSRQVVEEMARGALAQGGAHLAVAISGVAGPGGGSADKPVGTVWFAWATRGGCSHTDCKLFQGARHEVREQAIGVALDGLLRELR